MTIRKQIFVLASIIITIPILCVISIGTINYIYSRNPILEKITREDRFPTFSSTRSTKNTLKEFYDLPKDVDAIFLNHKGYVIASSDHDVVTGSSITSEELFKTIINKDKDYVYQFSKKNINNQELIQITRSKRQHILLNKPKGFYYFFIIIIVIVVIIAIIVLFRIFKNISNAVFSIQEQTIQIANGNLNSEKKTEFNKTPNELKVISDNIEQMRLSLLEAQNRKNKLIMGMSHDLRTPVAVIKGYTEALQDGIISEPEEIKSTLELINTKSEQLQNMINTLINFVKLNHSELKKILIKNNITKLIKDFANSAVQYKNLQQRILKVDINLPVERYVNMDFQLIQRAFDNLFSNAIRYTNNNDKITLKAYEENNSIIFSITDTGIGIAEKDLGHIFELFYRATNSRQGEGMGIGLSIVKSIIETHKWSIDVKSELHKGTCFTITIPIEE